MNQARRVEILEELVSNVDGFLFDDFQMDLDPATAAWSASEFVNGEGIAVSNDPVECYDMAMKWLEKRDEPKRFQQDLEKFATRIANRKTNLTMAEFKLLRHEAKRILKLKQDSDG